MKIKPNALIVFCGMDGTGKSTLACNLQKYFKSKNALARNIHAHTYTTSQNTFRSDEHSVEKYRFFWRLLIPFAYLDNLLTYFLQYRKAKRSRIIISDRYFYDKVVRLLYYNICPQWLARIYLSLLPQPDYVFFLDVSPAVAIKRKGEYNRTEHENFRALYQYAAKILDAPIIDTSKSIDTCLTEIVTLLKKNS